MYISPFVLVSLCTEYLGKRNNLIGKKEQIKGIKGHLIEIS